MAVRSALGLSYNSAITGADLLSLTGLDAEGWGIRSLTGLECAKNLLYLYLGDNQLTDITPPAGAHQPAIFAPVWQPVE